jgi:hypothetical protein
VFGYATERCHIHLRRILLIRVEHELNLDVTHLKGSSLAIAPAFNLGAYLAEIPFAGGSLEYGSVYLDHFFVSRSE